MREESRHRSEPPRLLLGAGLLFWSGMIGHPLVGLFCAVLVEGKAWLQTRWAFGERAFVRAWTASLVLLSLSLVWTWMDGPGSASLFRVLSWLPVFFLPVILVQQYSTERWMLLNTFSLFARRKMQVDRKKGREVNPMKIHFGYIYLLLVLVSAALGQTNREIFFAGLCIFIALVTFFAGSSSRIRPIAWGISLVVAIVFGFMGALAMDFAYRYFESGQFLTGGSTVFPSEQMTSIGRIGERKLSHRIHWRVKTDGRHEPSLYREAVFNKYGQGLWRHEPGGGLSKADDWANEMATRGDQGTDDYRFVFDRRDLDVDSAGAVKIQVTGTLEIPGPTPIPLPARAQLLRGLQADGVDFNSLGTVIVLNPDSAVTRFDAYLGDPIRHEDAPYSEVDLALPYVKQFPSSEEKDEGEILSDTEAVKKVVETLGIRGTPARMAMAKINQYFATEFDYTLFQARRTVTRKKRWGAIATFLLDPKYGKKGHCEYFATAATLLLREAGIPARYAVGYAAKERGPNDGEWLFRGKHGHAWCRVYEGGRPGESVLGPDGEYATQWSGGRWVDFDPTPPGWLAIEGSGLPWEQELADRWLIARQELLIWRSISENKRLITLITSTVGILTLVYVVIRLWYSRLRSDGTKGTKARERAQEGTPSPLLALVDLIEARTGPRPEGLPFSQWIRKAGNNNPHRQNLLEQAVRFHWRARFDPLGLEEEELRKFQSVCQQLKQDLI